MTKAVCLQDFFPTENMRALQTIAGLTPIWGGIATCTYDLLQAIHSIEPEPEVDLLTSWPPLGSSEHLMGEGSPWLRAMANDLRTPLQVSKSLRGFLKYSDYDLYHTNGMWLDINHRTCSTAREKGKPYVITPHGMLYPSAMKISRWKKWPLRKLWFDRDLKEASCVHTTCREEMQHVRALGYRGPVAVIGNPVAFPAYADEISKKRIEAHKKVEASFMGCSLPVKLGFMGRLHPIKKVENLLYGAARSAVENFEIVIIGKGDDNYENFLKSEIERLGLRGKVTFTGFLNGREKFEALASLSALMVPSDMENFGMIVPEALLVGTPVMASLGTPWESLNERKCGWWADNSPESLAEVINDISWSSQSELLEMGLRGRDFVMAEFSMQTIASRMLALYGWLTGTGAKPDFVHTL